jgi:hypothetical protein
VTFLGRPLGRYRTPPGRARSSAIFHWRSCARWRGLSWEHFRDLDPDDQAAYLAEYETTMALEYLEAEASRKAAERTSRRRQRHGRPRI